jgi:hypothetical protein
MEVKVAEPVLPDWLMQEAEDLLGRALPRRDVALFYAEMERFTGVPPAVLRQEGLLLVHSLLEHFESQEFAPWQVGVIVAQAMALLVSATAEGPEEVIWLRELLSAYYKLFLTVLDREINADGY